MILWDHTVSMDSSLEHTGSDLLFENKRTREGTLYNIGICLEKYGGGKTNKVCAIGYGTE